MSAIFGKEFKSSMRSMTGPIFIAFVLLWYGIYTTLYCLERSYSEFEYVISSASFLSLLALPLLTMRTFAEERHRGADKLLYSLPVGTASTVVAKYLSALAVFAIPTAVVALYPLALSKFGEVYLNTAYSSLFAYFLAGAALIAIGIFISSLTDSQVIAAIVSLGAIILLFFLPSLSESLPTTSSFSLLFLVILSCLAAGISWVISKSAAVTAAVLGAGVVASVAAYAINRTALEGLAAKLLNGISIFERMNEFFYGRLDIAAIIYYISITALFLFLTALSVEKRRWN
ncbi:MAG: ABC-2 transporter permease [Clostridia bacterium]|nr:ABC-2 transporter permease [Clostridia bacterium]